MTTSPHDPQHTHIASADSRGAPTITDLPRVPLYSPEFAHSPHPVYDEMRRRYGSLAPVELSPGIPATLVIGYTAAKTIHYDPEHFPADPREWQKDMPADCPVLPMLGYRPNALRSAGNEHKRFRAASVAAIDGIDLHRLHNDIEGIAIPQINTFCGDGRADLLWQYAFPVTFEVLNRMVGCTPDIGQKVATGMAMMFEGVDAAEGNEMFVAALGELVRLKRSELDYDLTSRLLGHDAALDNDEAVHQLVTIYGAGIEPLTNLITNTLLLMLTDDRFSDGLSAPLTRDALNELLFTDPPLANFPATYPPHPILMAEGLEEGVWLPAHQPVITSLSACNNDPEIVGPYNDNRSHLAWGIGPHACPAKSVAYIIAQDAIDQLLDALPEVTLACAEDDLVWRSGPFHRSLEALPVMFPPSPPLHVPGPAR